MAATHSSKSTGWSATSVSAGATTTGTAIDLTACYGATITVQVTTTTAPTSNGNVTLSLSVDNTTFVVGAVQAIGQVGSTTFNFSFIVDASTMYARIDVTAGTGTGVTVTAQCAALTGI